MYKKIINYINKCIKINKDFTISINENGKLNKPKYGYVISITPLINIDMNINQIIEYIVSNKYVEIDGNNHKLYIGGWFDKGKLQIDISIVVECKSYAIQIAKHCNQKAIYDLNKKEIINIKD